MAEKMKVALQLSAFYKEIKEDLEGVLRSVKEMGYDYVEMCDEGDITHDAAELKAVLDRCGLQVISAHLDHEDVVAEPEKTVQHMKALGMGHYVFGIRKANLKGGEVYPSIVEEVKKAGAILKDAGFQLLYHNHSYEFEVVEGKTKLDWMLEDVPNDLLLPQFDVCWVRYGGVDPCEMIRKYAGRIKLLHLKDFVCPGFSEEDFAVGGDVSGYQREGFEFRPLGQGIVDMPAVLKEAEAAGIEYLIVEQDSSKHEPMTDALRKSREYLRSLGY